MDSLIADFQIIKEAVNNQILGTLPIPNGTRRSTDEIKREYLVTENATSPLTNAGFTVKGIADDNGEHNLDICGYRISVNIPACTVGNNIANCNDWMNSHYIALLLLQHWLLENGCHPDAIHAFDLEHAQTIRATPTFLIPFSNNTEAKLARKALFDHAEAIYNYRYRNKPPTEDRVSMSGSSKNFSWYINTNNKKRFYIKSARIKKGFYDFGGDHDLEDALFYLGGKHLRSECDFTKHWLMQNNITKPSDVNDENQLFDSMFDFIRQSLWADFEFRERSFKGKDLPKKGSTDRILMKFYLAGNDVRQHPIVKNSYDADKYFSEVNKRARENHRVDYRIPWEIRKEMMCKTSSSKYLNATLPFLPPADLAPYCFGPHTAPAIIRDLQGRINAAKNRYKTIGRSKKPHSHAAPNRDESDENSAISDLMG